MRVFFCNMIMEGIRMKNKKIRITALAVAMVLSVYTTPTLAGITLESDIPEVAVTVEPGIADAASASLKTEEYGNLQQAAAELKQKMLDRKQNITVKEKLETENVNEELNRLLEAAYTEDSLNPAAGDYLRQSVLEMNISCQTMQKPGDSNRYCTFTFSCVYSSTPQQETYVTSQVKKIISNLKLKGRPDDEKIKAIYDYVTKTVDYDYKGSNNASSHSAYAALSTGKAVCQGYSSLIYRLLRECGISNRIITGVSQNQNHAWNIVSLNGRWYNMDVTWDSNFDGNDKKYLYFLKGTSDFADHVRDERFLTAEFLRKYPVSTSSYAKYQPAVTKVTGVKASKVTDTYVTLTWNSQKKAQYYYVCHLVKGKYQTSSRWKTTDNSFKITTDYNGKKLEPGKSYTYGVIAYNKTTGNTVVSAPVTVTLPKVKKPDKTSLTKLSSSAKKITAVWKKISSCSGYQLQYSTDKKFSAKTTCTVKITGKDKATTTIKSLKKGKTYYIRVRTWKKNDGKTLYSSWSTIKGMKCK